MTLTRLAIVLLLTVSVTSIAATARAQDAPDATDESSLPDVPPNYPLPAEAVPIFMQVIQELQDIRGLPFTSTDIGLRQVPPDRYRQRVRRDVETIFPPDRERDIIEGLTRLGMLDRDTKLIDELVTAHMGHAAVVYNTSNDRMLVMMEQIPLNYLFSIAPYRLARVLQDQHFNIGAALDTIDALHAEQPRPDDRVLAWRCLIDGEPAYLQFLWNIRQAGDAAPMTDVTEDETLKTLSTVAGTQITRMARPTLRYYATLIDKGADEPILKAMFDMGELCGYVINPVYAAQNKGAYFVSFLRRVGDWDDVERAYREPPVSTEQILHPEKLFYEPDQPTTITLPELQPLTRARWSLVDSAVHGEYHLFNLLRRWENDRFDARLATAGWDGDIYQAWKSPAETYGIIVVTTWDSEKDAIQFYEAYLGLLGRKYPTAQFNAEITGNRYTYSCGAPVLQDGWLILRGREVFILEGFPKDLGDAVLEQLEAIKIKHVQ